MKTPREILFERHRSAESKLDAVRQNVLASLFPAPTRTPLNNRVGDEVTSLALAQKIGDSLRRLLHSIRWHLAGMSAVWLVVMFLNMDLSPGPTASVAKHNVPTPRQLLASLQEYRRQLWLLMESPVSEPVSSPPRRSQRVPATAIV